MSDLIDGRTPLEVLKQQRRILDYLQDMRKETGKEKPLLIKARPGAMPEEEDADPRDYNWEYYKDVLSSLDGPIYTRAIQKNELCFDLDSNNYQDVMEQAQKIKDYLDANNIPYWMAYSGNRSIHFHVFFGRIPMTAEEVDLSKARLYGLDAYRITRMALVKAILQNAGADPGKMGIDWKKISFDMHRRGSMIREFGTVRDNGKYKTLIKDVPKNRPDYLPLVFPECKPIMWDMADTEYHAIVKKALNDAIEKAERNQEFDLESIDFTDTNPIDFPCMRNVVMSGVKDGSRYYMAVSGTLMCKKCAATKDETRVFVSKLLNSCKGLSPSDYKIRLDNALNVWDSDLNFSCRTFKENVGAEYCDYAHCPLKDKIQNAKEQKPIDWKTPLKQAVMDTQDADHDARIHAAKDILFNVLAEMSPIARRETFLECVCKDLKLSNRAANDIYKNFEININPLNRCEWFTEKGKFVPPVMSDQIRGQYHFITLTDTKEILVYGDKTGCYKPGGDVVIKQYAQQALDKLSKKSHVEETVYHVMNETFKDRSVFNSNHDCINLQNGIYNIHTRTFEDHRPDALFTYALPFKYDPNAVCSKFDDLLTNCGVNKTLIYEIFAYCLVPGYPIQSLFIFSGDGGNGKGTVIRVLRRFLGEENIVGHSMQALEKNRYALADLFGKLANICGDMPPTDVRDTSPIKTTTGGDAITAPVIYKGNITFENRAKMIFLLNHVPEFDDNTDSFDRRLVFQEFNNRVVGLDENFNEADLWTEEELSGIFNKCIEVLPDLLARGGFTGKMGIQETREYRQRKGNPIAAFVEDCTNYDDMKFSVAAETYAAYLKWCTVNHETCLTENVFGRKLLEKFPEYKKSRPTIGGSRVYCYNGFVLKEEYQKLNISEEAEKYVKSKDVVQDTQGTSRFRPGMVQDKNSDFSDTIDGNGVFCLGYPSKLSIEKNTHENSNEKDNANFIEEDRASILDRSKKEATDNESILDGTWTEPRPNPDQTKIIEECLDLWEKTACPIFAKNAHKAKLDIVKYHRAYGINPQLIYDAVDKRSKGRCLDCGSENATNEEIKKGFRCDSCHKIYSNPPPVVIPEEFSLEDPAEVTP